MEDILYISGQVIKEMPTTAGLPIDLSSLADGCIGVAAVFESSKKAAEFGGDVIMVQRKSDYTTNQDQGE